MDGTVEVFSGTGIIRALNDSTSTLYFTDWPSAVLALTDNSLNYICVNYNGGSPNVQVFSSLQNKQQNIFLGNVYRSGTTLTIDTTVKYVVGDHASLMIEKSEEINDFVRVDNGGAIIAETATKQFTISAGTFWTGLTKFSTAAYDSTVTNFNYYYRDGVGGWNSSATGTISNTQYDDGSGTLATLANNKYGVHWVYLLKNGSVAVLYGQAEYATKEDAETGALPGSLPPSISPFAALNAKIIIQKNAASFDNLRSVYNSVLT